MTRRHNSPREGVRTSARYVVLVALFSSSVLASTDRPAREPSSDPGVAPRTQGTRGLGRDGRWLTYNGRHPWFVGIDFQSAASRRNYDYVTMLDHLHANRINKIRIWAYAWFLGEGAYSPWRYANGRHDLESWDPAYWTRLREFVAEARSRDIVVEYNLFAPYPKDGRGWWSNPEFRQAWNQAFNVNGAFPTNADGHFHPQFYDSRYTAISASGKSLRQYQLAFVDKALSELGHFDNILFEVAQEISASDPRVYPWQQYMADHVRTRTSRLVTVYAHDSSGENLDGLENFWDRSSADVLNFHFYAADSDRVSQLLHPAQLTGKILQSNESYSYLDDARLDTVTREAWGFFTSAGYYGFYHPDHAYWVFGSPDWLQRIKRLRAVRDIAESVQFWLMSPVDQVGNEYDSLIIRGPGCWQVLANPGAEYVVYFWGQSPWNASVLMRMPQGQYEYTWYDARNGAVLRSGVIASTSMGSIPLPASTSWSPGAGTALVIRATTRLGFGETSEGRSPPLARRDGVPSTKVQAPGREPPAPQPQDTCRT